MREGFSSASIAMTSPSCRVLFFFISRSRGPISRVFQAAIKSPQDDHYNIRREGGIYMPTDLTRATTASRNDPSPRGASAVRRSRSGRRRVVAGLGRPRQVRTRWLGSPPEKHRRHGTRTEGRPRVQPSVGRDWRRESSYLHG